MDMDMKEIDTCMAVWGGMASPKSSQVGKPDSLSIQLDHLKLAIETGHCSNHHSLEPKALGPAALLANAAAACSMNRRRQMLPVPRALRS